MLRKHVILESIHTYLSFLLSLHQDLFKKYLQKRLYLTCQRRHSNHYGFFFFLNQNKYQHPLSFKWGQLIHASTCSSPLEDTISTYYNQDSSRLASDHIWEQSSLTMFKSHPDNHDAWLKGNDTLIFVIYR